MHRVALPPLDSTAQSQSSQSVTRARYSIPYFVAPDHDAIVQCISSCVTAEQPAKYEPVKWSEYGEYISKYMYDKDAQKEEKSTMAGD